MNTRLFAVGGSILGFLAVAAGAFGAHALKGKYTPEMLSVFETAASYQLTHALALLAAAWATSQFRSRLVPIAGCFFLSGIVVFSGSLYALVLTGTRAWGAVTPIGGVLLLTGWACLAAGAAKG